MGWAALPEPAGEDEFACGLGAGRPRPRLLPQHTYAERACNRQGPAQHARTACKAGRAGQGRNKAGHPPPSSVPPPQHRHWRAPLPPPPPLPPPARSPSGRAAPRGPAPPCPPGPDPLYPCAESRRKPCSGTPGPPAAPQKASLSQLSGQAGAHAVSAAEDRRRGTSPGT